MLPVNGASKVIPPAGAGCARGAQSAAVGARDGDIAASREAGWPSGSGCGRSPSQEGNRLLGIVPVDRIGGHLAAGADGPAQRPRHGRRRDRPGDLHQPDRVRGVLHNLQPGWVRLPVPALCRRPTTDLHPGPAPSDQAPRPVTPQVHELAFSTWSLARLAEFLVAKGVSTITCHEAYGPCSASRACPDESCEVPSGRLAGGRRRQVSTGVSWPVRPDERACPAGRPGVVIAAGMSWLPGWA